MRPAESIDVVVSHSPHDTVYLRMSAALTSRGRDPGRVPNPVPDRYAFALRPLSASFRCGYVPNAVVPIVDRADASVGDHVAALRDYPEAEFLEDLELLGSHTRVWEPVAGEPRRWLRVYADATWAFWQRFEPRWRAAARVIDRETERIGVAAVRGGLEVVLDTLSPRLRFAGDRFRLDGHCDIPLEGRRLILVPGLIAPNAILIHHDHPDVVRIAYSVPEHAVGAGEVNGSAHDRLALVIGAPRAAILRHLDVPHTMGSIAAHLNVTPAAVTRHCDQLERAGLIVRERRGQCVRVSASSRGRALRDLMG